MRSRYVIALPLLVSALVTLAGTPAAAAPPAPVAAKAPRQDVFAVVNGEQITKDAVVHRLLALSTIGQATLEELINAALLSQAAKRGGITVSEADIDARIADIRRKAETEDAFRDYLAGQEVTPQGLRDKLRVKIMVERLLAAQAQVTDDEVKAVYEQNKASFSRPEMVTLSMIYTKTEERAKQAIARLAAGESFAKVAKALSENGQTAQKGGAVGDVRVATLPSPVRETVASTQIGAYTQPIKMGDGFRILRVEGRTPAATQGFDDVKADIRQQMVDIKLQQAYVAWLKEVRDKASIERKWRP